MVAAFGWMLFNVVLTWLAIDRIRSLRYAPERRASVRFDVEQPALMDNLAVETRDVSMTGAKVVVGAEIATGSVVVLTLDTDAEPVVLRAMVRSIHHDGRGGFLHGLEFLPGQHEARAQLALALFQQRQNPRVDRKPRSSPMPELVPVAA